MPEPLNSELVSRITEAMRADYPDDLAGIPDRIVKSWVESGIRRARRYGFYDPASVTAFVGFMFAYAPNFDSHRRVLAVLQKIDEEPMKRVQQLLRLRESVWAEVVLAHDETAWNE